MAAESMVTGAVSVSNPERRVYPRYQVDCAALISPVNGGVPVAGRLTEVSRSGCEVFSEQLFLPEFLTRVEVEFELRGIPFRIVGVSAGNRGAKRFAVRFLDLSPRLNSQLNETIAEIQDETEAGEDLCGDGLDNARDFGRGD